MPIEYEIKLSGDREQLLAALQRLGAEPQRPRELQDDLVFDTPLRTLRQADGLLRLRRQGGQALLTVKGLSDDDGDVKARSEIQTTVGDGETMRALLEQLGYEVVRRYQKYRSYYSCPLPGCGELELALDETPIGTYLEIEGPPAMIHRCAAALGFTRDDYETRSYLEIYTAQGGSGDMLFDEPHPPVP